MENLADVEKAIGNKEKKYFRVVSGYTLADNSSLARLGQALAQSPDLQAEVISKLRVGIQKDTEVTATRFGSQVHAGPQQLVTQVYGSAISVSYSGCSDRSWEPFATLILKSSYEATLYAAVENALRHPDKPGAKRVFLTGIGGGVFWNPMSWIGKAMSDAFEKFKDYNLEIFLVSYGRREREFQKLEALYPHSSR